VLEKLVNAIGYKLVGRSDLSHQFKRYRRVISWVYISLVKFDKWRLTGAILNNTLGMTLQGGALTLLMLYGSMMEDDRGIVILDRSLQARDQYVFLAALVFIGLLLSLGGVMKYYGSKSIMYLSLEFARDCSIRALIVSASNPTYYPQYSAQHFPSTFFSLVTGFALTARSVRPLLAVSNPLTGFLYGMVALLYLDAGLTFILLLMSLPALFGQYIVNYHAVQNETRLLESQRLSKKTLRQKFNFLSSQPALTDSEITEIRDVYQDGSPGIYSNFYVFRKMASSKSALISDISTAVTAIVMATILGRAALEGSINWVTFLSYLVFARLAFMSFRGILNSITSFARHYPRIRGIHDLLVTSFPNPRLKAPPGQSSIRLATRKAKGIGDVKKQEIEAGSLTGIFCKTPISRYNSSLFINALTVADLSISDFLLVNFQCLPADFTLDSQALADQLDQLRNLRGVEYCIELLEGFAGASLDSGRLDDPQGWPELISALDNDSRKRLAVAMFVQTSAGKTLFIEYSVFQLIRDEWPTLLKGMEQPKFIFICSTELSQEFISCAEWHLAISNERAVAVMTPAWLQKQQKQLETFVEVSDAQDDSGIDDDDDD